VAGIDPHNDMPDEAGAEAPAPKAPAGPRFEKIMVRKKQLHMDTSHLPDRDDQLAYYLIRKSPDPVPYSEDADETAELMQKHLEVGIANASSLAILDQVIGEVYLPLLTESLSQAQPADEDDAAVMQAEGGDEGATEFLQQVNKFSSQLSNAILQVSGDVQLVIPDIPNLMEREIESFAEDEATLAQLENSLDQWTAAIAELIELQNGKQAQGRGPLAEVDYWKMRAMGFGAVFEQLAVPRVQRLLQIMEEVLPSAFEGFRLHSVELNKYCLEAKDNVKFLSTLERHFKNLTSGSMTSVIDMLPSMMNAIRMVWVISRNYNTDERMVPLMERIAWEIQQKVSHAITSRTIFKQSPQDAMARITEAKLLLEKWQDTYLKTRRRIEQSQLGPRWEFDQKRLFGQTSYMAKICGDLHQAAQAIEHFHNILGQELKAVTGDAEGINKVIREVDACVQPLELVAFDVFDRRFNTSWDALMTQFNAAIVEIEDNTKQFINASFKNLRSAEGAFDLLLNFKKIKSRDAINKQMMEKFSDVMSQYRKEIELVKVVFHSQKDDPPIIKNQPPVAGAIAWARSLQRKIKRPMLRFQSYEEMATSADGQTATHEYISLRSHTFSLIRPPGGVRKNEQLNSRSVL
jgi:dynein heavy chain